MSAERYFIFRWTDTVNQFKSKGERIGVRLETVGKTSRFRQFDESFD